MSEPFQVPDPKVVAKLFELVVDFLTGVSFLPVRISVRGGRGHLGIRDGGVEGKAEQAVAARSDPGVTQRCRDRLGCIVELFGFLSAAEESMGSSDLDWFLFSVRHPSRGDPRGRDGSLRSLSLVGSGG